MVGLSIEFPVYPHTHSDSDSGSASRSGKNFGKLLDKLSLFALTDVDSEIKAHSADPEYKYVEVKYSELRTRGWSLEVARLSSFS